MRTRVSQAKRDPKKRMSFSSVGIGSPAEGDTLSKLRRVWHRLSHARRWDRRTVFGLLALLFVTLALGSGIWWAGGGEWDFAGLNLLNWHIVLGFVLTTAIVVHMFARAKWS